MKSELEVAELPRHFYSLDALRGIAALTVVFWHWQHFFFVKDALPASFQVSSQPLYGLFFLFYRNGTRAVDLFFELSGFIFFWIYATKIRSGEVSAGKFFMLRFSRLYPLHLLTLLAVAAGQLFYAKGQGDYFVYPANDLYHFGLNIFLLPSVGLERNLSFNSPVWSVSVEMVLYTAFFLYCRIFIPRILTMVMLSAFGLTVLYALYSPVGRGVGSFFLGGIVFMAFERIQRFPRARTVVLTLVVASAFAWMATLWVSYSGALDSSTPKLIKASALFPILVLFPLTILSLASAESLYGGFAGALPRFLGDISYSSYLWHFPLQLLFATLAKVAGFGSQYFTSPWMLLAFFGVLLPLSRVSYLRFEMPVQRALRARISPATVKKALHQPMRSG